MSTNQGSNQKDQNSSKEQDDLKKVANQVQAKAEKPNNHKLVVKAAKVVNKVAAASQVVWVTDNL